MSDSEQNGRRYGEQAPDDAPPPPKTTALPPMAESPLMPRRRTEPAPPSEERTGVRNLIEWMLVLVGAVLIALLIRGVAFQTFKIPSGSMEPTLYRGDRVVVNKLSYSLVGDIERGDVVVFTRPENLMDNAEHLIKRVIAVPGDTVESDGNGNLRLNGEPLDEPWLTPGTRTEWVGCPQSMTVETPREMVSFSCGNDLGTVSVPEGHLLVLGDNRGNSNDGRVFGPIDEDLVVGRSFVKIWPPNRIGGM